MDWRVKQAIDTMARDLDAPLSIATLAHRANLSPSRFAHLFQTETGCAPARYLRQLRLDEAKTLLADTSLSVKEIMGRVGFNDPSHFARHFKRRHGISPRAVRVPARARSPGTSGSARWRRRPLMSGATKMSSMIGQVTAGTAKTWRPPLLAPQTILERSVRNLACEEGSLTC
jgi:AraC-like DNA-binding protein